MITMTKTDSSNDNNDEDYPPPPRSALVPLSQGDSGWRSVSTVTDSPPETGESTPKGGGEGVDENLCALLP